MVGVLRVARPRGRNAHAAGKAHLPVHHQQLAVGAVVQAGQVVPVGFVELFNQHPGRLHLGQVAFFHLGAAHPVEQHMHGHTGAGALAQGVGKLLADVARPVNVGFEGDAFLGGFDRGQHGRKDLVAVEQLRHRIAAHDARAQQAAQGALELRVGGAVQARQLLLHFFLARREVECQQDKGPRGQGREQDSEHGGTAARGGG